MLYLLPSRTARIILLYCMHDFPTWSLHSALESACSQILIFEMKFADGHSLTICGLPFAPHSFVPPSLVDAVAAARQQLIYGAVLFAKAYSSTH